MQKNAHKQGQKKNLVDFTFGLTFRNLGRKQHSNANSSPTRMRTDQKVQIESYAESLNELLTNKAMEKHH
jgi:hypothetical protein